MTPPIQLSDLQLAVMRILWDRGEATAIEVHAQLLQADRELAPTTVATILSRLEKRELVGHRSRGRTYIYQATVPESVVRRSMVSRLTNFFFGGDTTALLNHLVADEDVDPDQLEEVKKLISAKEREQQEDDDG